MSGIDTWQEVLILAIAATVIVALLLRFVGMFLRGGGKIKTRAVAVGQEPECAPYIREHADALVRMEHGIDGILTAIEGFGKTLREIDAIQGTQISAQKITLKWIKKELGREVSGEEINGDLEDAMEEVRMAEERYRNMRTIAGGI